MTSLMGARYGATGRAKARLNARGERGLLRRVGSSKVSITLILCQRQSISCAGLSCLFCSLTGIDQTHQIDEMNQIPAMHRERASGSGSFF